MKTTFAAVLSMAALPGMLAAPADSPKTYPEVIPGPGLPSLASLGLTSKMLYEMPVPKSDNYRKFEEGFYGECGPTPSAYTDSADINACYNYLANLGPSTCAVPASGTSQFCTAGQAQVTGQSTDAGTAESSGCDDVALALLWVINNCTRSNSTVAGYQDANGNGNLLVGGYNINY